MKTIIRAMVALIFEVALSVVAIWFGARLAMFTITLIEEGTDKLFGWLHKKKEAKEDLAK